MGMFTVVTMEGEFDGKPITVATESYCVGLYVATYWPDQAIPSQGGYQNKDGTPLDEVQFHRDVRAGKFFKAPVTVIEEKSSTLPAI